jgi:hypothetical protein
MLAEGSEFRNIEAWVLDHGGQGEAGPTAVGGGLFERASTRPTPPPSRYLLPAGALD